MAEADRTKLMKGESGSLGHLAGVKPGHRKKAHHRGVKRGDPRALAEQARVNIMNRMVDDMYAAIPHSNPFHSIIRPYSDYVSVLPVSYNNYEDVQKSPSFLRRLINRVRAWTLYRP